MHRRTLVAGLASLGVLAVSGCETATNIESQSDLASKQPSQSDSIAFGRLRWIENGQEKAIDQSVFGWSVAPRLRRVEDQKLINTVVDAGGHFAWSLQSGTYIMDRINYRDPMTGNYFFVPKVAFTIPRNGEFFYVGTLRADVATSRDFLGVSGAADFSVDNQFRAERQFLESKLGTRIQPVSESLMVQDNRLPDTFDSTAEFNAAMTLLMGIL